MDDASRDPVITEDEIRELQFSAGDVAEIEQTVLSFCRYPPHPQSSDGGG